MVDDSGFNRMVVRFGALVTVLAIAIEPFSQQLVQYRQAFRESEGGSVSQALRYDKGSKTVMFMREYTGKQIAVIVITIHFTRHLLFLAMQEYLHMIIANSFQSTNKDA
jgi:hypothetical protein